MSYSSKAAARGTPAFKSLSKYIKKQGACRFQIYELKSFSEFSLG